MRRPWSVAQAGRSMLFEPAFPAIESLPGNPEIPAGPRDTPGALLGVLQHLASPRLQPGLFYLRHRASTLELSLREERYDMSPVSRDFTSLIL